MNPYLESELKKLTSTQKDAVTFAKPKTNLLIEAGAGAGKTHVLSLRIAYHLRQSTNQLNPEGLFLVTFSKMAAAELAERIATTLEKAGLEHLRRQVHVSTIDSFFFSLLESLFPHIWEQAKSSLWWSGTSEYQTQAPTPMLVKESAVLEKICIEIEKRVLSLCADSSLINSICDFILGGAFSKGVSFSETAKQEGSLQRMAKLMLTEDFISLRNQQPILGQEQHHPAAQSLLFELFSLARELHFERVMSGKFTYSDVTAFLHNVICASTSMRIGTPLEMISDTKLPFKIEELIVDEYQDTNETQHEILYSCLQHSKSQSINRMIVVGDPKQSIYGFRNAHVGVMLNLKKHPLWHNLSLLKNFRTTSRLLPKLNELSAYSLDLPPLKSSTEFLNSVFSKSALEKKVESMALDVHELNISDHSGPSLFLMSASCRDKPKDMELKLFQLHWDMIASHISEIHQNSKSSSVASSWSDFAFIVEKNKHVKIATKELRDRGLPVQALLSKEHVNVPKRSQEFLDSLHSLFRCAYSPLDNLAFFRLLRSPLFCVPLDQAFVYFGQKRAESVSVAFRDQSCESLAEYPNLFFAHQILSEYFLSDSTNALYNWLKITDHLLKPFQTDAECGLELALRDAYALGLLDWHSSHYRIHNYEEFPENWEGLSLKLDWQDLKSEDSDSIQILTAHGSKGLEWKHVLFSPQKSSNQNAGGAVSVKAHGSTYVQWLCHNETSLAVLPWISAFQQQDSEASINLNFKDPYDSQGPVKSEFLISQKNWENNFERQRVFYTAFTRAKTTLSYVQPIPRQNAKFGIRDHLAKIEQSSILEKITTEFDHLEDLVFAACSTRYFEPGYTLETGDSKRKKTKTLTEPWIASNHKVTSLVDPEVAWIEARSDHVQNFVFPKVSSKPQDEGNTKQEFSEIHQRNIPIQSSIPGMAKKLASPPLAEKTDIKLRPFDLKKRAQSGTKHHQVQELIGPQNPLIRALWEAASLRLQEWEIWSQNINQFSKMTTDRHILDLVLKVKGNRTNDIFRSFNLGEKYSFPNDNDCFFVIDFKTGQPQTKHIDQIIQYSKLALNFHNTLFSDVHNAEKIYAVSVVIYPHTQKLSPQSAWPSNWLTFECGSNHFRFSECADSGN